MPTYDYKCSACSHSFELFQHIKENPVKNVRLRKTEGRAGDRGGRSGIFKESGFYQTDYRSEEYKSKAKKEAEPVKSEKSETKATEKK